VAKGDVSFSFRIFDGVDLEVDTRVRAPSSWQRLTNFYGRVPGRLVKREGSVVAFNQVETRYDQNDDLAPGFTITLLSGNGFTGFSFTKINPFTLTPVIIADHIVGLDTLTFRGAPVATLMGAIAMGRAPSNFLDLLKDFGVTIAGVPDEIFLVDRSLAAPKIQILSREANAVTTVVDGVWAFQEYGSDQQMFIGGNPSSPTVGFSATNAFVTNQIDGLFALTVNPVVSGNIWNLKAAAVVRPIMYEKQTDRQAGNDEFFVPTEVRDLTIYNGSLVLGGFNKIVGAGSSSSDTAHIHSLGFCNQFDSSILGAGAIVQVGDSLDEPITAVEIMTAQTDAQGIKGQLVAFTRKKVVIFDGLPPVEEDESITSFRTISSGNVGTTAPKAVERTPKGVVFVGTDKTIYLIDPVAMRPLDIGSAIRPYLRNLTLHQLSRAAAVYEQGFYKLSIPTRDILGAIVPTVQFWADLRNLNPQERDFGTKWSGDHKGQAISDFTIAKGPLDNDEVFGASANAPKIFQVSKRNLYTDDGQDIKVLAKSPQIDHGDAHTEKVFKAIDEGIATTKNTTVTTTVEVHSTSNQVTQGQQFVTPISAPGTLWGGFQWGSALWTAAKESFTLNTERSPGRLRGRIFQFKLEEESDGRLAISDVKFRSQIINRKAT